MASDISSWWTRSLLASEMSPCSTGSPLASEISFWWTGMTFGFCDFDVENTVE